MNPQFQVVFGLLLVLAVPALLGFLWWFRRRQLIRKAERDMKRGNQIYSEWRRKGASPKK